MTADTALSRYIALHSEPEPEWLYRLWRKANLRLSVGHMVSGHMQGRLLKMLTRMVRPARVLELGTFVGYSALCMAEGLESDECCVHTVEIFDELEDIIAEALASSPYGHRVHTHFGDATEIVPGLPAPFDMVFIDADKRLYPDFYRLVKPLVSPGGFILADNTLWDGHVTDPVRHDAQTEGIRRFNDMVASDPDAETVMLPLRDGLTLIHIKPNNQPLC